LFTHEKNRGEEKRGRDGEGKKGKAFAIDVQGPRLNVGESRGRGRGEEDQSGLIEFE